MSKRLIKEQIYIDEFDSYKLGYNGRPLSSNNGGLPMSDKHKEKICETWRLKRKHYYKDVENLYLHENKTTREICKILNISRNFLSKIFKENNIVPRKESGLKKREIFQYKDGNLIKKWNSINECINEQSFNSNGIRCVLNGKSIHYKGFYFSYEYLSSEQISEIDIKFKINSKCRKYYYIS